MFCIDSLFDMDAVICVNVYILYGDGGSGEDGDGIHINEI